MKQKWRSENDRRLDANATQMVYNRHNNTYLVINPRGQIKGSGADGKAIEHPRFSQKYRAISACCMENTNYIVFCQIKNKIVPYEVASDLSSMKLVHTNKKLITGNLLMASIAPPSYGGNNAQYLFLLTKKGTIYKCTYNKEDFVDTFSYEQFFSISGFTLSSTSIVRPPKKIIAISEDTLMCLTSSGRSIITLDSETLGRRAVLRKKTPMEMYPTANGFKIIVAVNKKEGKFYMLYPEKNNCCENSYIFRVNEKTLQTPIDCSTSFITHNNQREFLMLSGKKLCHMEQRYFAFPSNKKICKIADVECEDKISEINVMQIKNTKPATYRIFVSTPKGINFYEFKYDEKKGNLPACMNHSLSKLEKLFDFKEIPDKDNKHNTNDSKTRVENMVNFSKKYSSDPESICEEIKIVGESMEIPKSFLCGH